MGHRRLFSFLLANIKVQVKRILTNVPNIKKQNYNLERLVGFMAHQTLMGYSLPKSVFF